MPSLIRFFFGSAALALGKSSAADEATRAVEVRKVRRLSCINPLLLRDASHMSGNGVPPAIAFDEHIRESVLAAGVFAFVAALFSFKAMHHRGVAINPQRHCIQLEGLEFERPG